MKNLLWISFISLFLFFFVSVKASALTMKNDNFILQWGELNMGGGVVRGPKYNVGISLGQIAPGLYAGTNYKVRSGFQYVYTKKGGFTFSISNTNIDFGILSPTNPVSRTNILSVLNTSANGYVVTALANHPLRDSVSGVLIPDTSCDDGTCTSLTTSLWASTLTYGFGYRCDNLKGTDCASGFTNASNYKQFADQSAKENPAAIMIGNNGNSNKQATITYRVNISGSQPAGIYANTITYIATPTF